MDQLQPATKGRKALIAKRKQGGAPKRSAAETQSVRSGSAYHQKVQGSTQVTALFLKN